MVPLQNLKYVLLGGPDVADAGSLSVDELDTLGFDYCELVIMTGDTDVAMSALAVTESDTPGSNHANVTGLIWGTSTATSGSTSTLPTAGDDDEIRVASIDLRYRKRYLDVTATAGNGTEGVNICILAILARADAVPFTYTERNIDELLVI